MKKGLKNIIRDANVQKAVNKILNIHPKWRPTVGWKDRK